MTKGDLLEKIKDLPDTAPLMTRSSDPNFAFGYLESVYVKDIPFSEGEGDLPLAKEKCIILDDKIVV